METTLYFQSRVICRTASAIFAGVMRLPDAMRRGSVSPLDSTFTFVPPIPITNALSDEGFERAGALRGAFLDLAGAGLVMSGCWIARGMPA